MRPSMIEMRLSISISFLRLRLWWSCLLSLLSSWHFQGQRVLRSQASSRALRWWPFHLSGQQYPQAFLFAHRQNQELLCTYPQCPRMILRTIVASASPSRSSAMIRSGLFSFTTASRIGGIPSLSLSSYQTGGSWGFQEALPYLLYRSPCTATYNPYQAASLQRLQAMSPWILPLQLLLRRLPRLFPLHRNKVPNLFIVVAEMIPTCVIFSFVLTSSLIPLIVLTTSSVARSIPRLSR